MLVGVAGVLASCSSSKVAMPKGSSKGFHSVRLVRTTPSTDTRNFDADRKKVNDVIQKAMAAEFTAKGIAVNDGQADLIAAYLIVLQNNAATTTINDYFGSGRNADAIAMAAHEAWVNKGNRVDSFEAGTLVVDLIDAKTNKLVYRNYSRRDIHDNLPESQRRQRVNQMVAEALAPFFK